MLFVSSTDLAAACTDDESLTTWDMSRNSLQAINVTVKVVLSRNSMLHSNHCSSSCDGNYYLQWVSLEVWSHIFSVWTLLSSNKNLSHALRSYLCCCFLTCSNPRTRATKSFIFLTYKLFPSWFCVIHEILPKFVPVFKHNCNSHLFQI